MLQQQKLPQPHQTLSHINVTTKINKIDKETARFHDLIYKLRQKKYSSNDHSHNSVYGYSNQTPQMSDGEMKISKTSSEVEPPLMDRTLKKFHNVDHQRISQQNKTQIVLEPKDKDDGLKSKRKGQVNGRDSIKNLIYLQIDRPSPDSKVQNKEQPRSKQCADNGGHGKSKLPHSKTVNMQRKNPVIEWNSTAEQSFSFRERMTPSSRVKNTSEVRPNDSLFKLQRTNPPGFKNKSYFKGQRQPPRLMNADTTEQQHLYQPSKQKESRKRDASQPLNPERALQRGLTVPRQKQGIVSQRSQVINSTKNRVSGLFKISPQKVILQFIPFQVCPQPASTPNEIYEFFTSLCQNFGVQMFLEPLIKRYRNCVYFGQKVPKSKNQSYQGFVWYYRRALYYGNFEAGRKHGQGVQIDFQKQNHIWKGVFQAGTKTGYFQYFTPQLKYHGMMKNGYFHGEGLLETQKSKYQGNFRAGAKQGFGQEIFVQGNALYKGQYNDNNFEGEGELQADDYYYKGSFRDNKANGHGFERTAEYEYSGQFKNGKKNGRGVLKMKNGTTFQGLFRDGTAIKEEASKFYQFKEGVGSHRNNYGSAYKSSEKPYISSRNSYESQHRRPHNQKYFNSKHISNPLFSLSEQSELEQGKTTLEFERKMQESRIAFERMKQLKRPQFHNRDYSFPRDEENEEDPLEPKVS